MRKDYKVGVVVVVRDNHRDKPSVELELRLSVDLVYMEGVVTGSTE